MITIVNALKFLHQGKLSFVSVYHLTTILLTLPSDVVHTSPNLIVCVQCVCRE